VRESTLRIHGPGSIACIGRDPCSGSRPDGDLPGRGRRDSRSAVTVSENLMPPHGLRAIYQKPRTTSAQVTSRERLSAWWTSRRSRKWISVCRHGYSPIIPLRKGFLYRVLCDLFSRTVLSWKLPTAFDTEFCLRAVEMLLTGGRSHRCSTRFRCQFTSVTSWQGSGQRGRTRSAVCRGRCYTTSGGETMRGQFKYERRYCAPTTMAWEAESACSRFLWRLHAM